MKIPKKLFLWLFLVGALFLGLVLITACQPTEATTPEPVDQSAIHDAWLNGPHGNTYDIGKGPNTFCSRCHSPQNWDPESSVGPPPNCVTCKFPTDETIRDAPTMKFVSEEEWKGIGCETCHQLDENGIVDGTIAWLNPVTLEYDTVNTPNELCGKCHATTAGVKFTGGRGVTHEIDLGGSAHLKYAGEWPQEDRPQYCSDCHNAMSGEVKDCQDCHTEIATSSTHMKGFNAEMLDKVTCMACHDASGLDVGPHPDEEMGGIFVTLVTTPSRSGGSPTVSYTYSHSIQWSVACDRCHFVDNPWELIVLTAEGTAPTE